MKIMAKLALAFAGIVALLCLNMGVLFWSHEKRESAQAGREAF